MKPCRRREGLKNGNFNDCNMNTNNKKATAAHVEIIVIAVTMPTRTSAGTLIQHKTGTGVSGSRGRMRPTPDKLPPLLRRQRTKRWPLASEIVRAKELDNVSCVRLRCGPAKASPFLVRGRRDVEAPCDPA